MEGMFILLFARSAPTKPSNPFLDHFRVIALDVSKVTRRSSLACDSGFLVTSLEGDKKDIVSPAAPSPLAFSFYLFMSS